MKLLALLYRDVCSSELYYHNPCHIEFTNQYRDLQSKGNIVNDEDNISILLEFVAIGAIKQFIDDSSSFPLKQLENIYIEKMHTLNQNVSSHTTRFAQKLEVADIGLIVQQSNTSKLQYIAVKTTHLSLGCCRTLLALPRT